MAVLTNITFLFEPNKWEMPGVSHTVPSIRRAQVSGSPLSDFLLCVVSRTGLCIPFTVRK